MTLPAVGTDGLLPPGRHTATLDEIEAVFVDSAPNADDRRLIWDAFSVWFRQVSAMLPGHRFWINGGFVTYKTEAPKDVDVVILARASDLDALSDEDQALFESLLTGHEAGGSRSQPMGGLVDAHVSNREDPTRAPYWHGWWSTVKEPDGSVRQNATKGYVEVIA